MGRAAESRLGAVTAERCRRPPTLSSALRYKVAGPRAHAEPDHSVASDLVAIATA